jgi:hypothetical protein
MYFSKSIHVSILMEILVPGKTHATQVEFVRFLSRVSRRMTSPNNGLEQQARENLLEYRKTEHPYG